MILDNGGGKRLDGWKAISGYFGRDRSTVMRWAQHGGLPVHRMHGAKGGSVFAYEAELAAWASQRGAAEMAAAPAGPLPATPAKAGQKPATLWASLAIIALATAGLGYVAWTGSTQDQPAAAVMPANAAAAADYLAARDHWARRTPDDLRKAIALYQRVIASEPGFAPAYAGLSEAWLIIREYGETNDLEAYNSAHTAALRALALDPDLASGHRAMGFIHYWRENDGARAIAAFKRAIAADPADSQTHFWYANILSDLGDHDAARASYDKARLLSPGSRVIEVEAACAEWQAGRDAVALERLSALARQYPDDATVHNCLAWLHIGQGDIRRFAKSYAEVARARGEPVLIKRAAALTAAVARDPKTAHRVVTADMRRELSTGERRGRETPAFYASAMGDREELLSIMADARNAGEQWVSATITTRIAQRWKDDKEVQYMIGILRAPKPETRGR
jgi:tetratricopeptide (TPR) repeat protein